MKVVLQISAVVAVALSLTSCGLPGALVRTASNTVQSLGGLANGAMSAAGY